MLKLEIILLVAALAAIYWFWIRAILRRTPALATLYAREESVFAALAAKFGGIKQKLATAFVTIAGLIVMAHDQLVPIVASSGADFSSITAMVPNWAWPIVLVGVTGLLQYFRNLADSRGARDA